MNSGSLDQIVLSSRLLFSLISVCERVAEISSRQGALGYGFWSGNKLPSAVVTFDLQRYHHYSKAGPSLLEQLHGSPLFRALDRQ